MSAVAPIPIIAGIISFIVGIFWIWGVAAEDESQSTDHDGILFILFGTYLLAWRFINVLVSEPLRALPGIGFIALAVVLVWVGVLMTGW